MDQAVLHGILVNVIQPRKIRFFIGQFCVPVVVPPFDSRRAFHIVQLAGSCRCTIPVSLFLTAGKPAGVGKRRRGVALHMKRRLVQDFATLGGASLNGR